MKRTYNPNTQRAIQQTNEGVARAQLPEAEPNQDIHIEDEDYPECSEYWISDGSGCQGCPRQEDCWGDLELYDD